MNNYFEITDKFINHYLPFQRGLSPLSISAYASVIKIFTVSYLHKTMGVPYEKISFNILNKETIKDFLIWLEQNRGCSARTLEHRLTTLRTFFTYAGEHDVTAMRLAVEIKQIPKKKYIQREIRSLSEDETAILFQQPDISKDIGIRNLVFMILLYDSGARLSEILNLKLCDLNIQKDVPEINLIGKGNKERTIPISGKTARHLECYIRKFHSGEVHNGDIPLFYVKTNGKKHPMSPDAVQKFMKKYANMANKIDNSFPKDLHPHMLRHSRAMHMIAADTNEQLISRYLGHASVDTTRIYARANLTAKSKIIEKSSIVNKIDVVAQFNRNEEEIILKKAGLI